MADPKAVVERWLDAIEARDVDRIMEMLAEDITLETELLRSPIRGKQTIESIIADSFEAYESIRLEPRKIVAAGRDVAVLLTVAARFSGDIEVLGQKLSTTGKELEIDAAAFVEVTEDGKIARVSRVRDTLTLIHQLGLSQDQIRDLIERFQEQIPQPPRAA